jgi:alpha-tubulin suppressor-like RCC1 family protein
MKHAVQRLLSLTCLVSLIFSISSCSSGGGEGAPPLPASAATRTIVSGTVQAPGGQVAFFKKSRFRDLFVSEAYAALTGLANVPDNTIVQLARLNTNASSSSVILTTTTSGGRYSFNLTALGLQPANDLIVRVAGSGGKEMRAFVVGTVADISPVSEAAYQLVVQSLNGRSLSNLTLQEVSAISGTALVIAALENLGSATSVDQAVALIKGRLATNNQISGFLAAASQPGQTSVWIGDIGNFFPLEQGNIWKYQVTGTANGLPIQAYENVVSVNGTKNLSQEIGGGSATVLTESNPDGTGIASDEYVRKDSSGVTEFGVSDQTEFITPQLVPYQIIQFPLTPGYQFSQFQKQVDLRQDLDGDGRSDIATVAGDVKILGLEDVTVGAGHFMNAAKIQTRVTATAIGSMAGDRATIVVNQAIWLAPGVGVVRKMTTRQFQGAEDRTTEELTKFIPQFSFASISTGSVHTCGVTVTGKGYCWGRNEFGQLDDGTTTWTIYPVAVSGNLLFSSIAVGSDHSCGLTTDGQAYCWGAGSGGRLGTGNSNDGLVPIAISGGHTFRSLSSIYRHTCGISIEGRGYCWGFNDNGQLGNGLQSPAESVPALVAGSIRFGSISVGPEHTCGLETSGKGFCWGNQNIGVLGNGDSSLGSILTPNPILGNLVFSQIGAGADHSCGVTRSGQAYCWGLNSVGQLGNGTTSGISAIPVPVTGGLTFLSLNTRGFHTCAITTSGSAYCWGENGTAQIGDGTMLHKSTPVPIAGERDSLLSRLESNTLALLKP